MMKAKALGKIVEPIFQKMGADVEHPGDGTVAYTTTVGQLRRFFEQDPLGKLIMDLTEHAIPLSEMLKKVK